MLSATGDNYHKPQAIACTERISTEAFAYLRDMFGTRYVGAIHGLLLTAWSMAGILGPVLVNYIREYNVTHGVAAAQAYNVTMYLMAGLLVIGFICNFFVKSVDERFHMRAVEAEDEVEAPVFGEG